jgi:hypothetical protein
MRWRSGLRRGRWVMVRPWWTDGEDEGEMVVDTVGRAEDHWLIESVGLRFGWRRVEGGRAARGRRGSVLGGPRVVT